MKNYIINPETGRKCLTSSKKGIEVLNKYPQLAGSSECAQYDKQPLKCHSTKTSDGNQCLYKTRDGNEVCYQKNDESLTFSNNSIHSLLDRDREFNMSKKDARVLDSIEDSKQKEFINHCIPCTQNGLSMKEWYNRSCDVCLDQDNSMDPYFEKHPDYSKIKNRKKFSQYKKERQEYENKVKTLLEEKSIEIKKANLKQSCKNCNLIDNIDDWNENNCDEKCLDADDAFNYTKGTFKNKKETLELKKANEENEKKIKLAVLRTKCEPCINTSNIDEWMNNNCDQCIGEDLRETFSEKDIKISLTTFSDMKAKFEEEQRNRLLLEEKRINEIKSDCVPCNSITDISDWSKNNCDNCIGKDKSIGLNENTLKKKKENLEINNQKNIMQRKTKLAGLNIQCSPCINVESIDEWNKKDCKLCIDDIDADESVNVEKNFFKNKYEQLQKEDEKEKHDKKVFLATKKADCEPCYNTKNLKEWKEKDCDRCLDADEAFNQPENYFSNKKEQFLKTREQENKEKEIKKAAQKKKCSPCVNVDNINQWNNEDCNNCLDADEALNLVDGTLNRKKEHLEKRDKEEKEQHKLLLEKTRKDCEPCYNSNTKEEWDSNNCDKCLSSDEAFRQSEGYMINKKNTLVKKYLDEQMKKQIRKKEKEITCKPCFEAKDIKDWIDSDCDNCIDDEVAEIFNVSKNDIILNKEKLQEKDAKLREEEELRKITTQAKCQPCIDSIDIDNWNDLNCDECMNSDKDMNLTEGKIKSIKEKHVNNKLKKTMEKKVKRATDLATCKPCSEVENINEWNNINCDVCLNDKDWILEEMRHNKNTEGDNIISKITGKKDTLTTFTELKKYFEKKEEQRKNMEKMEAKRILSKTCSPCINSSNINDWNNSDCNQCLGKELDFDSGMKSGDFQQLKNDLEKKQKLHEEEKEVLSKCSDCGTKNQSIDDWNNNNCDWCVGKDKILYKNSSTKKIGWKIDDPLPENYNTLENYKQSRKEWEDRRKQLGETCITCLNSENIHEWKNQNCDQCIDKESEFDNNYNPGDIKKYKKDLEKIQSNKEEIEKVGKLCKDKCSDQISINKWNDNNCDWCLGKDEIMMAHYDTYPSWKPGDKIPKDYVTFEKYKKTREQWEENAKKLEKKCSSCINSRDLSTWEYNNCDQCLGKEEEYNSNLETGDIKKFKNKLIKEANDRMKQEEEEELNKIKLNNSYN